MGERSPGVSICICTYKRPALLQQLLHSIAHQINLRHPIEIVIVENDQQSSASEVVRVFSNDHPDIKVVYALEQRQGISFARNRTVELARGEYLAFIDDDEIASPVWLTSLLNTMSETNGDCIFGPVIATYPPGTKKWVQDSKIFERNSFATGQPIPWQEARCGNALINAKWATSRTPAPFDVLLGQTGGEDSDFFKWVQDQGAKLFWCAEAAAFEEVPPARQTIAFVLNRSLRTSTTYWRGEYASRGYNAMMVQVPIGTVVAAFAFVVGLIVAPFQVGLAVRAWSKAMKGLGRVVAILNVRMIGYGTKP